MEISIHLCVFLYTFVWTFSIVWVTSKTIQRRKTRELNRGAEKRDCRNKISWFRQRDLTNLLCISSVSFNPCCFNLSGTTGFSQNKPPPPPPSPPNHTHKHEGICNLIDIQNTSLGTILHTHFSCILHACITVNLFMHVSEWIRCWELCCTQFM